MIRDHVVHSAQVLEMYSGQHVCLCVEHPLRLQVALKDAPLTCFRSVKAGHRLQPQPI